MSLATRNAIFFAIAWLACTLFTNYLVQGSEKEMFALGKGEETATVVMLSVVQGIASISIAGLIISVLVAIASAVKKKFAMRKGEGAH